jgi:hypothetical protein
MASLASKGPEWLAGRYSSAGQQEYDEQCHAGADSIDDASTEAPAGPSEAEQQQQQQPSLLSMQGLARVSSYFPATCLGFSAIAGALLLALGVSMLVFVGVTRWGGGCSVQGALAGGAAWLLRPHLGMPLRHVTSAACHSGQGAAAGA